MFIAHVYNNFPLLSFKTFQRRRLLQDRLQKLFWKLFLATELWKSQVTHPCKVILLVKKAFPCEMFTLALHLWCACNRERGVGVYLCVMNTLVWSLKTTKSKWKDRNFIFFCFDVPDWFTQAFRIIKTEKFIWTLLWLGKLPTSFALWFLKSQRPLQ